MSAVLAASSGVLDSSKHRVLPGSADLFIAFSDEASSAPAAAVECLTDRLQRQRRQAAYIGASERAIVAQPASIDGNVWLYEQLRVLLCELNGLLAALSPHCTAAVCPVMAATADWEFLCAAHGNKPVKCSAMAYMCHTLTSFGVLLSDAELFPGRSAVSDKAAAVFPSVCRRLYRLFAHASHHHRALFEQWERQSRSCSRFLALLDHFQLMDEQQRTPAIPLSNAHDADSDTSQSRQQRQT